MESIKNAIKSWWGRKQADSSTITCDDCKSSPKRAERYCNSCRKRFCITCGENHKHTTKHIIEDIGLESKVGTDFGTRRHADQPHHYTVSANEQCKEPIASCSVTGSDHYSSNDYSDNRGKPGKPHASDDITADSIVIYWSKPNTKCDNLTYEVRRKTINGRWIYAHGTLYTRCSARISNLKQNTEYVFQVRVASDDDNDFPWSEMSAAIKTKKSAAYLFFSDANYCIVNNPEETPQLGRLNFVMKSRDAAANIRKLSFGKDDTSYIEEKTILFLGETGVGKSTLTNMLVNHIMGVVWTDEFRFSIIDLEREEQNRESYQSQTRWITSYSIAPVKGGKLKYRLNIIDTPGFDDTDRSEFDIDKQIKTLFNAKNTVCLHAVCIVTKGDNNRMSPYQKKLFNSMLSIFGNDIKENILVMTTHNNVPNPAVLAFLKHADVQFKQHFSFDNKPFVERGENAEIAWILSNNSLKSFFDYIDTLSPCSLLLTREVLDKMVRVEEQIKNLAIHLRDQLRKRRQIQQEMRSLEQYQNEVEAMEISIAKSENELSDSLSHIAKSEEDIKKLEQKSEKYFSQMQVKKKILTTFKRDLPEGDKSLNCPICMITCASSGGVANYLPNFFSGTMSVLGNCKRCLKECDSSAHSLDSFEYVTEVREVVETLPDRLQQYRTTVEKKNEKRRYSAQCKAEADTIRDKLFKEKQQHSERQTQVECSTEYIDTYKTDLRKMEHNIRTTMVNLCQSFDILVKNQLRKKHHSLREYLESCFDDSDKDMFLKELDPFLLYSLCAFRK